MALDIQFDILNDAPATASPVEANFNRVEDYVNQELIARDGTVAMTAELMLAGDPVDELGATPKQYVDALLPIGIINMYGGTTAPPGGKWAICNGAELETAVYPELFDVIGSTYSLPATPAGRFNLPNLVDRFPVGQGTIGAAGASGGSRDPVVTAHTHTINHQHTAGTTGNDTPDHAHAMVDHLHPVNGESAGQSVTHTHGSEVANGQFMTYGVGGVVIAAGGSAIPFVGPFATGPASADHSHTVGIWSGAMHSGTHIPIGSANTHGASVRHAHPFTTPNHTGDSGSTGVTGTNTNLPPYLCVTYIMRIQ